MSENYRPDVHGLVEGPMDTPLPILKEALDRQCPDCNVNVFIEKVADDSWRLVIAHDETCPWLAAHGEDR